MFFLAAILKLWEMASLGKKTTVFPTAHLQYTHSHAFITNRLNVVEAALLTSPLTKRPMSYKLNEKDIYLTLNLSSFIWNFLWHISSSTGSKKRTYLSRDAIRVLQLCTSTLVKIFSSVVHMAPPISSPYNRISSINGSSCNDSSSRSSNSPLTSPPSSPPPSDMKSSNLDKSSKNRLILIIRTVGSLFECARIGKSWNIDIFATPSENIIENKKSTHNNSSATTSTMTTLNSITMAIIKGLRPENYAPITSTTTAINKVSHDNIMKLTNETRRCCVSLLSLLLLTKQLSINILVNVLRKETGEGQTKRIRSSILGLVRNKTILFFCYFCLFLYL